MNHQFEEEHTPAQYVSPSPETPPALDPRIEDYLDHICAPMVDVLSYDQRVARRTALREAIEPVVAAHVELGASRDEAIDLTMTGLRSESETNVRGKKKKKRTSEAKESIALESFGFSWAVVMILMYLSYSGSTYMSHDWLLFNRHSNLPLPTLIMLLAPLLAGFATGLHGGKKPALNMFRALSKLGWPTLFLMIFWIEKVQPSWNGARMGLALTIVSAISWSLSGLLGVGLGHICHQAKEMSTLEKAKREIAALVNE